KETKNAPPQAKPTKLAAGSAKPTKQPVAPAKPTKLAPPSAKPPAAAPAAVNGGAPAQPFQITCPKCRATPTWKARTPAPIGKRITGPRRRTVYVVPPPKAKAVANTPAKAPVIRYACPGCKAVLKTAAPLAAGKGIKCPRCQRTFGVPAKKPTAPPAKP